MCINCRSLDSWNAWLTALKEGLFSLKSHVRCLSSNIAIKDGILICGVSNLFAFYVTEGNWESDTESPCWSCVWGTVISSVVQKHRFQFCEYSLTINNLVLHRFDSNSLKVGLGLLERGTEVVGSFIQDRPVTQNFLSVLIDLSWPWR